MAQRKLTKAQRHIVYVIIWQELFEQGDDKYMCHVADEIGAVENEATTESNWSFFLSDKQFKECLPELFAKKTKRHRRIRSVDFG